MVTMVKAKAKEAKIKGGKGERRLNSLAIADVREPVDAKKISGGSRIFKDLGSEDKVDKAQWSYPRDGNYFNNNTKGPAAEVKTH